MSAQALGGAPSGVEAGELAAAQRVQQLQQLIEASRQVSSPDLDAATASEGPESQAAGGDFASALQAATSADATSADSPAVVAPEADPSAYAAMTSADYQPAMGAYAVPASDMQPATLGQSSLQQAPGSAEGEYEPLIDEAAARNGLDPAVLHGLIEQESGFDPSATSGAGAMGLTQLMPGTASSLGVADPLDPAESIEGGARYLSEMMARFGGNTADALAAYNAGPGAVEQYGGVPPYAETEGYVSKVLGNAEAYRETHPAAPTTGALV